MSYYVVAFSESLGRVVTHGPFTSEEHARAEARKRVNLRKTNKSFTERGHRIVKAKTGKEASGR